MQNKQEQLNSLIHNQDWDGLADILVNKADEYKTEISNMALIIPQWDSGDVKHPLDEAIKAVVTEKYDAMLKELDKQSAAAEAELHDITKELSIKVNELNNEKEAKIANKIAELEKGQAQEMDAAIKAADTEGEGVKLKERIEKIEKQITLHEEKLKHKDYGAYLSKKNGELEEELAVKKEAKKSSELQLEATRAALERVQQDKGNDASLKTQVGMYVQRISKLDGEIDNINKVMEIRAELIVYKQSALTASGELEEMVGRKKQEATISINSKYEAEREGSLKTTNQYYDTQQAIIEGEAKSKMEAAQTKLDRINAEVNSRGVNRVWAISSSIGKITDIVINDESIKQSISYLVSTKNPDYIKQAAKVTLGFYKSISPKAGEAYRTHFIKEVVKQNMISEVLQISEKGGGLDAAEVYEAATVLLKTTNPPENKHDLLFDLTLRIQNTESRKALIGEIVKGESDLSVLTDAFVKKLDAISNNKDGLKYEFAEALMETKMDIEPFLTEIKKLNMEQRDILPLGRAALNTPNLSLEYAQRLYDMAGASKEFIEELSERVTTYKDLDFLYEAAKGDAKIAGQVIVKSLKEDSKLFNDLSRDLATQKKLELAQMLSAAYQAVKNDEEMDDTAKVAALQKLDFLYTDVLHIKGQNALPTILGEYSKKHLNVALAVAVSEYEKGHPRTEAEVEQAIDASSNNIAELILHAPSLEAFDKTEKALDRLLDPNRPMNRILDKAKAFFAPILRLLHIIPAKDELADIAAFISGQKRAMSAELPLDDKKAMQEMKVSVVEVLRRGVSL